LRRLTVRFAVNQEYVAPETALHEGDEVVFIPPVSGGGKTGGEAAPWR